MAAEFYDRGNVLMNGVPIADLESGTVEVQNGFQPVTTINKGYAGGSKGALVGTITAKRAVPRAGYSAGQDLHTAVTSQRFIQFMAICGGKKYVVTGVPSSLRRDFGVSATAMEDLSLFGSIEVTDL